AELDRHLYRVARGYVRDAATAEDVVQDTWLAIISGIHRFQRRSSLRTWASHIATKRAISTALLDARCRPLTSPPTDAEFGARTIWSRPAPTPEEALLARERRDAVARAIAALPARQRMVLTLRDLNGATSQEACREIGVSKGNQRVLLHRARSKVRIAVDAGDAMAGSRRGGA